MDDLHRLPKFRDAVSYLYVEHARIDQHEKTIALHDENGMTPVPTASLSVLMLGPGSNITHAAIRSLADNNCLAIWCGEQNVRFYAFGMGGTRSSAALLRQAKLASDNASRLEVVKRMYRMRFNEDVSSSLTGEQLRGMEAVRVRKTYTRLSEATGVEWTGRNYDRSNWNAGDLANRALSAANSCLYGICHAGILSLGYSPAIGFIHTGKQLSFVYDIADLYKTEISIPLAFRIAALRPAQLERNVRLNCRDLFKETRLLERIVADIHRVLGDKCEAEANFPADEDQALPTPLWTPNNEPEGGEAE